MAAVGVLCRIVGWVLIVAGVVFGAATVWDAFREPVPLLPTSDGESDAWSLFFATFVLMAVPIVPGIVLLGIANRLSLSASDGDRTSAVDRD